MFKILSLLLLIFSTLNAYQSEQRLKSMLLGKVAKFVSWQNNKESKFIITILSNPFGTILDELYKNKKIKSKKVKIVYIKNIDELKFTNILYIPRSNAPKLNEILQKVKNKNILTVSSIKGFAEKQGVLQIYFISQKAKLKINLQTAKDNNLKISSSLLRVADVIKDN